MSNIKKTLFSDFKLPIDYLDPASIHPLSPIVASDLELDHSSSENQSMYEILLKPKTAVSKSMVNRWNRAYTSDPVFLKETQHVITNIPSTSLDLDKNMLVWKDLYDTTEFYDRYGFIDFKPAHSLNQMSGFLGCWTVVNLLSPLLSLFLPLIFLIAPFVLLKIQGVPIDFNTYLNVLKSVAKNHAIGKLLTSFDDFSVNNFIYIIFTLALYGLQMYQNTKSCIRFYKNIFTVNTNLISLKEFVGGSIQNMEGFLHKTNSLSRYSGFCDDVKSQLKTLHSLRDELIDIKPFTFGISKCFEVGYLLKCYYSMHVIPEYKAAFNYAMAFEAYREGLSNINSMVGSSINMGSFTNSGKTRFENQVYPTHTMEGGVKGCAHTGVANTVSLDKNLVITGPNGSGKTSQLKSTAINIILTQQFGIGFYESCELAPYTHIHSYLNIPDTSGRDSLFQAEARRCKEILDIIEDAPEDARHFGVFDELFSGTNAEEATSASYAFLKYLQKKPNVDFILTTHFEKLCKRINKSKNMRISNHKMEAFVNGNDIKFTYKLLPGYSKIKGAKLILIQMGFPNEILNSM
jgi:hypothetical protein